MGIESRVVLNSIPLRRSIESCETPVLKEKLSLTDLIEKSCCSSRGVVIWKKEGCGEVLTKESFSDQSVHYIFNKSTKIVEKIEDEALQIGSEVEIMWTASMNPVAKENKHVIIHIEFINVYNCTLFRELDVVIVHNTNDSSGISIGMTEENEEVAFHPSCSSKMIQQTYEVAKSDKSEFVIPPMYARYEILNQIKRVMVIIPSFPIEISGSIEKIRSFVIRKLSGIRTFEGPAIVKNVIPNIFIEAQYIENAESIYLSKKACHSNLVNKIKKTSLVFIRSTENFKSSKYHWYGYEASFVHEKESVERLLTPTILKKLMTTNYKNAPQIDVKNVAFSDINNNFIDCSKELGRMQKSGKKKLNEKVVELNRIGKRFKRRYYLIGEPILNMPERSVEILKESYNFSPEYWFCRGFSKNVENPFRAKYDMEMKLRIEAVLDTFNLRRKSKNEGFIEHLEEEEEKAYEEFKIEKKVERSVKIRPGFDLETILKHLAENGEGFAKGQKIEKRFSIPDTKWQPRERRYIGVFDDLQWVMMETFVKEKEEIEEMTDLEREEEKGKKLADGWWYRRTVAREAPTTLVKELVTRRNIIRDCTICPLD